MASNEQCAVQQGPFRCKRPAGHKGEHEADSVSPKRIGPHTTSLESSAYLQGALDFAGTWGLDQVGKLLEIAREENEDDYAYRNRIWRTHVEAGRTARGYTGPLESK